MLPIHPFRTSLYVSLALAILAVGVAGFDLLPEFPYITAFCLAGLGAEPAPCESLPVAAGGED